MKREITINWRHVAGYLVVFYPTVDGEIANVELAPSGMTIIVPPTNNDEGSTALDFLPIAKIALHHSDFSISFKHDNELVSGLPPDFGIEDLVNFFESDKPCVGNLLTNRNTKWRSDVEMGKMTEIMIQGIGASDAPEAVIRVTKDIEPGMIEDEDDGNFYHIWGYFESVELEWTGAALDFIPIMVLATEGVWET
jgi:hypothetical protein